MGSFRVVVAGVLVTLAFVFIGAGDAQGFGSRCKYEDFFGRTSYYTCPRPGDDRKNKYCCGDDKYQACCDKLFGVFDDETVKGIAENAGAIIGVIVVVILIVVAGVILCCCCCSCCLLAKMRNKRSHRNGNSSTSVPLSSGPGGYPVHQQQQHQHQATSHHVQQSSYPQPYNQHQQQQQLPQHSASYPSASGAYPGAGAPYPTANQGYPAYPGGQQPPYPMPDQPPPYSDYEKQPAYNPNYAQ